jgi:hypothetical protein
LSEVVEKIRSKGHWEVSIRPEPFTEHRVDYGELDEVLSTATVRLRGWPVPFIDHREEVMRGADWIGQDIDATIVSNFEAWRFFTSGQFSHLRAVSADWRTGSAEATPVPQDFTSVIEVWEILFYLTEVFELAARLALSPAGDERMTIDASLNGLEGRALVVGQRNRAPFFRPYRTTSENLHHAVTLPRHRLISESRSAAVEGARDLFLRFGWKPSIDLLAEHQQELTGVS